MSIYYVRKAGDDTTGNGSSILPWLTISKALTAAAAGDTVKVGDGAYEESTGAVGYFYFNSLAYASFVTIEAENGAAGNVTVSGSTSTTYSVRIRSCAYLKFRYIKFVTVTDLGESAGTILLGSGTGNNHIEFYNCTFTARDQATGLVRYAVFGEAGGTMTIDNILFDGCTFNQSGANDAVLARLGKQAGATIDNITFRDCTFTGLYECLYLYGIPHITLDRIHTSNTSAIAPNVTIGENGDIGLGCSGTIQNSTFTATVGHALLVGAVCSNVTITGNTINGGDQGLVLKHCYSITVTNNRIINGSVNAFYCKGATNVTASGNKIINGIPLGVCVNVGKSADDTKSGAVSLQHNKITAIGTAVLFSWGDTTEESGGSVCDYNRYKAVRWGTVWGSAVTSLATLKTAWATYGDGSNDLHSRKAAKPLYLL